MAVLNLSLLSSELKIHGGQVMTMRAPITAERLSKVHDEIFRKV